MQAGAGVLVLAGGGFCVRAASPQNGITVADKIKDPDIRAGVTAAIEKNLLPAAGERQYPGHFTINADAGFYGADSTWPGLDSWQMAGAYLRLGRVQLVLDYFDFVRAAQRKDGNIPWAIFTGTTRSDGAWIRGLKYPDDLFAYDPPKRAGLSELSQTKREWIGLFSHWQTKADPLSNLGTVCYILTAAEIFETTKSVEWLKQRLASVEAAAKNILSRKSDNGLIGTSGFYTELPPRYGWDGITQCYVIFALRQLSELCGAGADDAGRARWAREADVLSEQFNKTFWRGDHFAEYVHAERGLVDAHGLSDVNWAAVGLEVASDEQGEKLWPRLMDEKGFWAGDVPTQTVSKPASYEKWEYHEPLPFAAPPLKDASAMGRVWYLEALACRRMKETGRLIEGARLVCRPRKTSSGRSVTSFNRTGRSRRLGRRNTASIRRCWCGRCWIIGSFSSHRFRRGASTISPKCVGLNLLSAVRCCVDHVWLHAGSKSCQATDGAGGADTTGSRLLSCWW
jgi:hypothetical protein